MALAAFDVPMVAPARRAPPPVLGDLFGDFLDVAGWVTGVNEIKWGATATVNLITDPVGTLEGALSDVSSAVEDAANGIADAAKEAATLVKDAAPYLQLGLSCIPGIGTAASAALGAGLALAEGRGITDALIAGAKGACPGGPYVADAFEQGLNVIADVAGGQSLADAAGRRGIDLARAEALNAGGQAAAIAFDTAVALAQGKKIQDAGLSAAEAVAKGALPDTPEARAALQITHGALRGEDTIATLTGAASELIPLAPGGAGALYATADDALSVAEKYAAAGYAVVRDVGSLLGGGGMVAGGKGSTSVASRIAANRTFSGALAASGIPTATTNATRVIAASASNPLRVSAFSPVPSLDAPTSRASIVAGVAVVAGAVALGAIALLVKGVL